MKKLIRHPVAIVLALAFVAILWAAFRPELLFVNKSVNDPFPTAAPAVSASRL